MTNTVFSVSKLDIRAKGQNAIICFLAPEKESLLTRTDLYVISVVCTTETFMIEVSTRKNYRN